MVQLNILIPDHMKAVAEDRASKLGYPSVDAYITSLIVTDVADEFASPNHLVIRSQEHLSALLKEGESSASREMTSGDWNGIRERLEARAGIEKAG